MIRAGKVKQYSNVLEKPLNKGKQEVSLSAFAFLFSELVQYNQTQVDNIAELERRLEDAVIKWAAGHHYLLILTKIKYRRKLEMKGTRLSPMATTKAQAEPLSSYSFVDATTLLILLTLLRFSDGGEREQVGKSFQVVPVQEEDSSTSCFF